MGCTVCCCFRRKNTHNLIIRQCWITFSCSGARRHQCSRPLTYASLTSFAPGDRVYYVCGVGYAAGGSRYRECRRGRWTRLLLRCTRKLCGTAGEILNGAFMYTGVKFGDVARAVCDVGHRLVGLGIRNCMSKGWDGRVPTCEAVQCDVPPEVPNAEMRGNHEQSYPYRSTVGYRCLTGTLTGSRDIWCTEDGTWSSPPPTCEGPTVVGDTISVECKPGYTSTGRTTVTCGSNGRWSPGLPTCSPILDTYKMVKIQTGN
uniref:Sushi domain-containing protein n=1 Tax=Mola mola TaxID=94237 RepID=A0A3Q3WSH2_MOLML